MPKEIEFTQDTEERRRWFRAASFSHPAKMVLGLQIYLIEHYTKAGETILDPMTGSGTVLVGCALGRNVVCVELEKKFVKMIEANWDKIKSLGPMLGYKMGEATILQGDARNLQDLLVDKCIFSPPFADSEHNYKHGLKTLGKNFKGRKAWETKGKSVDKIVTSPPYAAQGFKSDENPANVMKREAERRKQFPMRPETVPGRYGDSYNNIGNLPYGEISAVISSPPFQEAEIKRKGQEKSRKNYNYGSKLKMSSEHPDNISKLAENNYGDIDAVITSPPYEGIAVGRTEKDVQSTKKRLEQAGYNPKGFVGPSKNLSKIKCQSQNNIGNLKSENYLEAMAQVYRQCHKVLKDGGLLCLVVKNFVRDKKLVRLDLDTIKLCEKAGFVLKERLKRKLTHQSFWRILYQKKFPDAPKIEFEDVLIFAKARPDATVRER